MDYKRALMTSLEAGVVAWAKYKGSSKPHLVLPHRYQFNVWKTLSKLSRSGGLVVVRAPTAAGKTETACTPFFAQVISDTWNLSPRLIYALPNKTLLSQVAKRLKTWTEEVKTQHKAGLNVDMEHGMLFGDRHYLYGAPIVTATIDVVVYCFVAQRIPGGYRNPRPSLPAGLLSTSLLVLDEVHLVQDSYWLGPRVLGWLIASVACSGGITLLLTATMPSNLLDQLVEHSKSCLRSESKVEIVEAKNIPRGIVNVNTELSLSVKDAIKEFKREIKEVLDRNKHVLIVVNKPIRARQVAVELRKTHDVNDTDIVVIHGKMTRKHRRECEESLIKKAKIIVATQVVESGLDHEVGAVITELAPLDCLIQRIGRASRDPKDKKGWAVITGVSSPEPYVDDVIKSTREVIENVKWKEALTNVSYTTELLDEIYTKDVVEKLATSGERLYLNTLAYLGELRLFALPPEEDFAFKPDLYGTLIIDDRYTESWSELKREGSIDLRRGEAEKLFSLLEEHAFNADLRFIRKLAETGHIKFSLVTKPKGDTINLSVRTPERIEPLSVYVVDQELYDDMGLKVEKFEEKTTPSVKNNKREER